MDLLLISWRNPNFEMKLKIRKIVGNSGYDLEKSSGGSDLNGLSICRFLLCPFHNNFLHFYTFCFLATLSIFFEDPYRFWRKEVLNRHGLSIGALYVRHVGQAEPHEGDGDGEGRVVHGPRLARYSDVVQGK